MKRRGGCAIKKMSRSNLSSRRRGFAELTTPSAALRRLRTFLLMPQPPLLFKEGNVSALEQSVNSHVLTQWLFLVSEAPTNPGRTPPAPPAEYSGAREWLLP